MSIPNPMIVVCIVSVFSSVLVLFFSFPFAPLNQNVYMVFVIRFGSVEERRVEEKELVNGFQSMHISVCLCNLVVLW